jgi:outer membrane protein assembly factor BamB
LFVVLLFATNGACAFRPARAVRDVPAGVWHATLGGPGRAAFVGDSAPPAPVESWRHRYEPGITSAPIVHGDLLILANARMVTVVSAGNGSTYWSRRFDGAVVGSALRTDSVLFVATASRRGKVHALGIARGRQLWEARLRAPVTSDPVLADGNLYASTVRGELFALDPASGRVRWQVRLPGQSVVAPVPHEASLLVATQRDTLLRVRAGDGTIEASTALPGSASAPLALAPGTLVLPLHPGVLAAFDPVTLARKWTVQVGAPVLAAPAVDRDGTVFVLNRTGEVWRVTPAGNATRIAQLDGTARESFTLAANGMLVGLLDGTVVLLGRDGTERWREVFRSSLRSPVAVHAGKLYVALLNGTVVNLQ